MPGDKTLTFTAASNTAYTHASWLALGNPSVFLHGGAQIGRLFVRTATNGGAGTLRFILRDSAVVLAKFDATFTSTAARAGLDGASGAYLNTVAFDESATSKFDLLGDLGGNMDANAGSNAKWYVGCTTLPGGETSVICEFAWAGISQ